MKNLALIGYGYWGPNLLRVMDAIKEINVKYVCDMNEKRREEARSKYPSYEYIADTKKIFSDSSVDGVVIATPIDSHFSLAMEAMKAGKDVFVEKPITGSSKDAEELVAFAKKSGRILMTGHTFVFSPPVMKMREIVRSGELGDIFFITSSRVNLGIHRKDISVIWDLAPHDLSIIYSLIDEEPVFVDATGRDSIIKGIPDVAFISLKFPSKIVANIELSWLSPTKMRKTTIVGSNKMLIYDDSDPVDKIRIYDKGIEIKNPESFGEYQLQYRTGDMYAPRIDSSEPLKLEMEEFIKCIDKRCTPVSDGEFGLKVVKTIEEADRKLYKFL